MFLFSNIFNVTFVKVNGYPTWVVRQVAQKVVMEHSEIQSSEIIDTNKETRQTHIVSRK